LSTCKKKKKKERKTENIIIKSRGKNCKNGRHFIAQV